MRTPRWKIITYALIIIAGLLPVVPNLLTTAQLSALPAWVSDYRITLGLDLQGGMHFVLDIDADTLVEQRLLNVAKDAKDALADAKLTKARTHVAGSKVVRLPTLPITSAGCPQGFAKFGKHHWVRRIWREGSRSLISQRPAPPRSTSR